MTPKQADRLIAQGKPVQLHNAVYDETFTVTLVRRDRRHVYGDGGQVFERNELEVIPESKRLRAALERIGAGCGNAPFVARRSL